MGSQVLGAFVYETLFQSAALAAVNYLSILLALGVYAVVFGKFAKAARLFG